MSGKKIVITGATRGIGRALAETWIAEGHTVVGCGRSAALVDELNQRHASPHRFDTLDVSDPAAVATWSQTVLEHFGPPDLLINNAAIIGENRPLWEVPTEEFSRVIDINIKGVFYVLKGLVPAMIEANNGVIVNVSSGWGRTTSPEVATYCSTKYAIEGLTQALSAELPSGMAAIPLSPGIVHTELLEICFTHHASEFPGPDVWVKKAAPYILSLGRKQNGQSVSVPQ